MLPGPFHAARPRKRAGLHAFPVAGELLLLPPEGEQTFALNESGTIIWGLCDGRHTLVDMLRELGSHYDGDPVEMLADLSEALLHFHQLGLIELSTPANNGAADATATTPVDRARRVPRIRFVFGIEDRPFFHWQLAILFESLIDQLPTGWDVTIVVCNDHTDLSTELSQLIEAYNVRAITGTNHAHSFDIDFSAGRGGYAPLNRVEALNALAAHVEPDDIVCLMDTDIFLYGDLQTSLFPAGNALAANRTISDPFFMGYGRPVGVDLQKLLSALGCETKFKPGGVTVFLTGATIGDGKVVQDCFRFAQVLYLLGKVAGLSNHNTWVSEMACFAMALTANGIHYDLLDIPQFEVPKPQQATLPESTFFHYYADVNDGRGGPFAGSEWNKQLFRNRDFLRENLESFLVSAEGEVERRFLDLAMAARSRLHEPTIA